MDRGAEGSVHKVDLGEGRVVAGVNVGETEDPGTIGYVYAFDLDGFQQSKYKVSNSVLSVHIGEGHIAAGSLNGYVYVFDLSGDLKWEHQHTEPISNWVEAVHITGDYVAAGSDTYVTVYNLDSGDVKWKYKTGTVYDVDIVSYGNHLVIGGRRGEIGVVGHLFIFDLTKDYKTPIPMDIIIFCAVISIVLLVIFLYAKRKGHI